MMDPSGTMAERLAGTVWREGLRLVVVDASPMRPGRGRRTSPPGGRRPEGRRNLQQFETLVARVVEGLRSRQVDADGARREVDEAGRGAFVRVAENREGAVLAFASFFDAGYYLEDVEERDSVARVRFSRRKQLT